VFYTKNIERKKNIDPWLTISWLLLCNELKKSYMLSNHSEHDLNIQIYMWQMCVKSLTLDVIRTEHKLCSIQILRLGLNKFDTRINVPLTWTG